MTAPLHPSRCACNDCNRPQIGDRARRAYWLRALAFWATILLTLGLIIELALLFLT